MRKLSQYTDQFDKLVADNTKNKAGLNAAQPYTPKRWRVHYNGNRRYIRYGDDSNFADNGDYFTLSPASGDTMTMRTAKFFRYVPQYTIKPSLSMKLNQPLGPGDKITLSYGSADLNNGMTDAVGWILEFVPSLDDDEMYFSTYRKGSITSTGGSKKKISLDRPITDHKRFALETNWYNVGNAIITETFTKDGFQKNVPQGYISSDGVRGPESGNHYIEFSFTSGGNGTELHVGSVGFIVLGDPVPQNRAKRAPFRNLSIGTADDTYQPLIAFQGSDRETKVSVANVDIVNYSASDDVDVLLKEFGSEKVNFGGGDSWKVPGTMDEFETTVRSRQDISGYAGSDGVIGNAGYGGSQLIFNTLLTSGQGSKIQTSETDDQSIMKEIYFEDIAVLFARSNTIGDLRLNIDFEEEI